MKTILIKHVLLCTCVIAFLFSSCKKDEPQMPIDDTKLAEDAVLGEQMYNDIFQAVNTESGIYKDGGGTGKVSDTNCGTVVFTGGGAWPTALTIDYGAGCTDAHGVLRKGKIMVVYSGAYFTAGSSLTISTDNYYLNGYTVDGAFTIQNNGINNNNHYEFAATVQQGRVLKPDGSMVTFESSRVFEWDGGQPGVFNWCDNAWIVTGFSEGTTSDGHTYRAEVVTPLRKGGCCSWVGEGSITIEVDGSITNALDYGNGSCDRFALYTHNGLTDSILLP